MNTADRVLSTAMVLSAARAHRLPEPIRISADKWNDRVEIVLATPADLADWAQWAEATIEVGHPRPLYADRCYVDHRALGSIHELDVELSATESGRIVVATSWFCDRCGAAGGSTAGFVADADDYADDEPHVCSGVA